MNNEVSAVDKYEYKLKTDEMLELMEDGAYKKAAEIADSIDWKRVRNVTMLTNVSDIYEKNTEYQKSYDVLTIAYHRGESSRKVIYRLCTLALKTGNVDEAIDYYDDFVQIAPKDPNQHILRYQILRAQRAPVEQQIEALEEFKKAEYIEEWAYELAKLYQEAGMTAECLEECDDLILWFSEGQYVYKAMELKMQYKPLTPSQQEKYDRRNEKVSLETEEMPDLEAYAAAKAEETADIEKAEEAEESSEQSENPVEEETVSVSLEPKKKKLGNTMRLDEALQKLLHPENTSEPAEEVDEKEDEPDITDLEGAIDEIESVVDLDMVSRIAEEKMTKETVKAKVSGGMKEIIPEDDLEEAEGEELIGETAEIQLDSDELEADDAEEVEEEQTEDIQDTAAAETVLEEVLAEIPESSDEESGVEKSEPAEDDQIEGQMSLEDILAGWDTPTEDAEDLSVEEEEILIDAEDSEELLTSEDEELLSEAEEEILEPEEAEEAIEEEEILEPEEAEEAIEEEEILEPEEAEETIEAEEILESDESEELESEIEKDLEEEDHDLVSDEEGDILTGEENDIITEGVTTGETMEEKKKTEPILPPDIQRMIDEIEGVIPPEEPKPVRREKRDDGPRENMGKLTEELRIDDESDGFDDDWDDAEEWDESDDFEEIDDYAEEEDYEEIDEFDDGEDFDEDEDFLEDTEELEEDSEAEEFEEEDYGEAPDLDEEFRVNPDHSDEPDDREIPDDDDDDMDILSATTPLSRKETAKMIATGKTAPLPLDEISDALSMSDTGFIVHGRYDLEMQSGIGTRAGLTEEQKKLFSYFVPVRGMSEQLVDVLEQDKNCTNRGGTSRTGNLLIIGNKGNGKTVLAVDVVKAIQKQRNIRQGKVAIVTGDSLNKKKISDIFDKLYGGALIIEKAGKLNEKTVARLNKAMERDTGELLIVLEEQRKPLDRLLSSNREFRRKFTSRLEVPIFINDELVTFGQTYAQENGYRIDEMGILALYSKIDSLQREDHAVTVAEVKEVMDEAIQHSQKASAKKLVKRVFGRNTDDADRILLSEKDFNI